LKSKHIISGGILRSSSESRREKSDSIEFTFNSEKISAKDGDSIASALIHAGIYEFKQSVDNSKRGIFCGMGACYECLVDVKNEGEKLACMTSVKAGIEVRQKSAYPVVEINGAHIEEGSLPEIEISPDVLVIGAGPAGLACASILAESGISVVILDERAKLGGQYFKQPSDPFLDIQNLDQQFRDGRALIQRAQNSGAQIYSGTAVWGAFGFDNIVAANAHQRLTIRAKRLVISTGAYERGLFAPGWTLPGVMTTGAAQTLLRSYNVRPGKRSFIAGNGPLNIQMAAELVRSGGVVVGLSELANPFALKNLAPSLALFWYSPSMVFKGMGYFFTLIRAKVPIYFNRVITDFRGESVVQELSLSEVDKTGHPVKETSTTFEVDSVAIGYGFLSSNEIARSLGCKHEYDEKSQSYRVVRDEYGTTSLRHVHVIGDGGGISGAQVAQAGGVLAASKILSELGCRSTRSLKREVLKAGFRYRRNLRFQKWLWRVFDAPTITTQVATEATVVCRCLGISHEEMMKGMSDDVLSAGALKRITRTGMGICQGRYCGVFTLNAVQKKLSVSPNEFSGFAPQVPYKPTSIGIIAQFESK
jgi:thioredoxin reductase